jgi:group I intron endonuclease
MENNSKKWEGKKSISQKKSKMLPIEQSQKNIMSEIKSDLILLPENDIGKIKNEIPNTPGIYKILNKVNGKFYIGSANKLLFRLYSQHLVNLRLNKHINCHLQGAWNLYGEENFTFEIVELVSRITNETDEEFKNRLVFGREQYYLNTLLFAQEYINKKDNIFLEIGYNLAPTASSTLGYRHSEESISKMTGKNNPMYGRTGETASFFGRKHSEESNKLNSKSNIGRTTREKNHFFGKTHTEESKKKMREGRQGKTRKKTTLILGRPVLKYNLNNALICEYDSINTALLDIGFGIFGSINSCCNGHQKTAYGYVWKYKESKKNDLSTINEIKEKYNNGKYTQRQLSSEYRISPNKISQILKNKI